MAAFFSRSSRALPYVTGAAVLGAGATYYASRPRIQLESAQNAPTPALSFPSSMPFPKKITVTDVEQVNHDTKKITFSLPGGDSQVSGVPFGCKSWQAQVCLQEVLIGYTAAILTSHWPENGWLPVFRPYTPISAPDDRGTLQLLVKQYPKGRASSHLHSLIPGSTLTVRGPIPAYTWQRSTTPRELVLIAGGAGITPIYSMARGILSDPEDQTRIQMFWGVNSTKDIVLGKELEQLEQQYPSRLRVTFCVSGAEVKPDAVELAEPGRYKKGYVSSESLREAITRAKAGGWGDAKGTKVFICGPPAMEEAIAGKTGWLGGEYGVAKKEIHAF
ncbi:hypothetical protein LTS01_019194 [Friedmanniomyces endolithicus]|nr:hypothetical protein LTS01_019194 [Friedmanniomyces endolithicus]